MYTAVYTSTAGEANRKLYRVVAMNSLLAFALALASTTSVRGCTEIHVRAATGQLVIANAEESGLYSGTKATPTLRGSAHGGHAAGCMRFNATYGWIGNMNERGLVLNEHALDLARYQTADKVLPTLCRPDVVAWILGLHATVAEVVAGLAAVRLTGPDGGGQWGVTDALGRAVVLEYVKGELRAHNNTAIGIMTNDPTYDWHVNNLNNYVALSPSWYTDNSKVTIQVDDDAQYPWVHGAYDTDVPVVPTPIGHAYNLLGLPGDGSPPARFIRAFFLRQYAYLHAPPASLDDAKILATELLNSVYKVLGSVAARDASDPLETTPESTLHVPATREVFFRSRADMTWRRIDLTQLDFSPTATRKSVEVVHGEFGFVDVTKELL